MERVVYNTLFAAQSPDGRQIRYYTPLEGPRVYQRGDAYCCPGNYRRIVMELPSMIYYQDDDGLAVNLYTASEARLRVRDTPLVVRQETDYPNSGTVIITMDPETPLTCALRLRIPSWCPRATVQVNEEESLTAAGGTFCVLDRSWKAGDRVRLDMPMTWRLVRGRQRQAGRVTVLRGPLVFGLDPERDPGTQGQDPADLGGIWLDPETLGETVADASARPDGLACEALGWKPGHDLKKGPTLPLRLTEFADPGCRLIYFRLRDFSGAVDDELLGNR